jgi:hypothetical protein
VAESVENLYGLATCGSKGDTLLELLEDLGKNLAKSTRWAMPQDLERYGVKTRPRARVVLAVGTRPLNLLQEAILARG